MSDKTQTVVDESLPAVLEDIARTDVTVDVAELELQSTRVVSWLDSDPEQLRSALVRRSENRRSVIEWIWENLVENVDYGRIHVVKDCPDKRGGCTVPHHFSKPSLWKPGAEKIVGMLDLRAEWPELVDEMRAAVSPDAKTVALRCVLLDRSGKVISEGVGARSLEREYWDVNKALKMAKKSSLIDAVLNAAGLSEVFTQDDADGTDPDGVLDETGQQMLLDTATKHFGEKAEEILASLARRRFKFSDGNWKRIPAFRLQDAIRSIEEKSEESS
jgi:hypothetical protein